MPRFFSPDETDYGNEGVPARPAPPIEQSLDSAGGVPRVPPQVPGADGGQSFTRYSMDPANIPSGVGELQPFSADTSSADDNGESGLAENAYDLATTPKFPGGQQKGMIAPPSYHFEQFGPEGQSLMEEAYINAPARERDALAEYGHIQEEKGTELGKRLEDYGRQNSAQMANAESNRIVNQREFARRQAVIDKAADDTSRDLADRGQFWRNPGNILSAIGAAIIAWGSPHDPSVGVRLIDQQVMNDWNQRREAANQHMGELRSNLSSYRQLMGDREAGDQMGLAQSWKQMSIDIDRIGAQFGGKEAKARAKMLSEAAAAKAASAQANAWMTAVYKPAMAVNPEIYKKTMDINKVQPGSIKELVPQKAPKSDGIPQGIKDFMGDTSSPQVTDETKARATARLKGEEYIAPKQLTNEELVKPGQSAIPGMDLAEKRAPGSINAAKLYEANIARRVSAKLGPNTTKEKWDAEVQALKATDKTAMNEAMKQSAVGGVTLAGWRNLRSSANQLKQEAKANGWDLDSEMGHIRDFSGNWQTWYNTMSAKYMSGDRSPEAVAEKQKAMAVNRFRQQLAGAFLKFKEKGAGASMNEAELSLLHDVLAPNSTWDAIEGFINMGDADAFEKWNNNTQMVDPGARQYMLIRSGVGQVGGSGARGIPKKKE